MNLRRVFTLATKHIHLNIPLSISYNFKRMFIVFNQKNIRMKKIVVIAILLIINNLAFSQSKSGDVKQVDLDKLSVLEDSIVSLSRTAVTDSIAENRIAAQDKLLPLMREALAVNNSFNYAFSKIESISLLYLRTRFSHLHMAIDD